MEKKTEGTRKSRKPKKFRGESESDGVVQGDDVDGNELVHDEKARSGKKVMRKGGRSTSKSSAEESKTKIVENGVGHRKRQSEEAAEGAQDVGPKQVEKKIKKPRAQSTSDRGLPAWRNHNDEEFQNGPFTERERELVLEGIGNVLEGEGIECNAENIRKHVNQGSKDSIKDFWPRVTLHVPGRSTLAIYRHAKRRWAPITNKGEWSEREVDQLRDLVQKRGHKWTQIGEELGRLPGACKDKWRDDVQFGGNRKTGRTSSEEHEKLTELIVKAVGDNPTTSSIENMPWTAISREMGTRSYSQCLNAGRAIFKSLVRRQDTNDPVPVPSKEQVVD
ncbi:hypothetical protein NDN08_007870 [Rhodosorus marinus]|uniref:Myb-like domain-containing protein n=1 Tax=Rhodosorus marinus TaxID=101924 RepID=A0AAV8UZZ8_9RHOD|nr:hypothetical protein NDN08_007870 [Rhodosorus marinus]